MMELSYNQEANISLGIYHILFINEFIDFQINDYIGVLNKHGMLIKKIKMLSNRLNRSRLAYQYKIRSCLMNNSKDANFLYECADKFIESLNQSYQILFYTTRNLLLRTYPDRKNIDWMTYAHIINLLFEYSQINQEAWEKKFKEEAPGLFQIGSTAKINISDWKNKYELLTNEIIKQECHIAEKANENEVINAFKIFIKHLSDIKVVKKCIT